MCIASLIFYLPDVYNYEIVKSQRGKDLLLLDGYTYSNTNCNTWICSTHYPHCRAKLKRDYTGRVSNVSNDHTHPPRKYYKTKEGNLVRI